MGTNEDWEQWAKQDPYFAVITDPGLRSEVLNEAAMQDFFASGRRHLSDLFQSLEGSFGSLGRPRRALDYGCGTGRILVPLSEVADAVVGVDIAPSMLAEARENLDQLGIDNVDLVVADDELSQLKGQFDFLHVFIVLQHIPIATGCRILRELVGMLEPGGVGAIHLKFGDAHSQSMPETELRRIWADVVASAASAFRILAGPVRQGLRRIRSEDPAMEMNSYPLNVVFGTLMEAGVHSLHADMTDHGGELGTFLYFKVPDGSG